MMAVKSSTTRSVVESSAGIGGESKAGEAMRYGKGCG